MDNVSYALGLGIGSQLKSMGAESLNIDDFAQAIKDVLNDSELKISMADSQKIVQKFFQEQNRRLSNVLLWQRPARNSRQKARLTLQRTQRKTV